MYLQTDPNLQKILRPQTSSPKKNIKWAGFLKIGLALILTIIIIASIFVFGTLKKFSISPGLFFSLLFNTGELKQDNNLTNFLLLGTGGARHEGPNLTDSIMFISFNNKTGNTTLLSLPRDIWIPDLKQKLNSAYAIGQADDGKGMELVKEIVSTITGRPVHYGIAIDFLAFQEIIDIVGGIDVYVDKTFDDYKYPLENGEYEMATISGEIYKHLHFEKGLTHMEGETALQFVRSRNSEDPEEGSDFARAKRQQKIILALKNKLLSRNIITDIPKLQKAYRVILKNVDTDIRQKNLPKLLRLALKFDENKVRTVNLNEGTEETPGFLENPDPYKYGTWVLIPRGGSWKNFQEYLKFELGKK